jgi:hypothetical protein
MNISHRCNWAVTLLGKILFPRTPKYIRRRDTWFLLFSLVVGVVVCAAFGWVLVHFNQRGRI